MSLRLAPRQRLSIDITLAVVFASGVAWLALDAGDAMSDTAREWLRNDVRVHALAGLACIWLVGTLWLVHIRRAWHNHRNRVLGSATFTLLVVLIATGYALGYLGGEAQRAWIARAHWILGLAGAVVYLAHRWRGPRTRPPA